jgi:hypothetical protein
VCFERFEIGFAAVAGVRRGLIAFGGAEMNSRIAFVAYCVAAGFILAVAFHSVSKRLVTADVPAVTDVQ